MSLFVTAVLFFLSLDRSSLWTDEAYSAWMASHRTLNDFWVSLRYGNASDLQTALHYLYLFGWAKVFGFGEAALRSSNAPFLFILVATLAATSSALFRSHVAWVPAAATPFIWHFASEVRPYLAVLAFSTMAAASAIAFIRGLESPGRRSVAFAPWICIFSILIGSLFSILTILAIPPIAAVLCLTAVRDRSRPAWTTWVVPLKAAALPVVAIGACFVWSFSLPTLSYAYPDPSVPRMLSVAYELAGMSAYGPNRQFSVDFQSFLLPVTFGLAGLACAGALTLAVARSSRSRVVPTLFLAALVSIVEAVTLSLVVHRQFDARHLAALIPIGLILLIALVADRTRAACALGTLLSLIWILADIRARVVPEYQREDYRGAVAQALAMKQASRDALVLAADPMGPAYYGLGVSGPKPCIPLLTDCQTGLSRVPWQYRSIAVDAEYWPPQTISDWLASHERTIVILQLDRAHRDSPWVRAISPSLVAERRVVHGFEVVRVMGSHALTGP